MNRPPAQDRTGLAYVTSILGALLIVAALVGIMQRHLQPPAVDGARAAERAKALAELRAAEAEAMRTPTWLDQSKGLVRLPVETAVNVVVRDWGKSPAAARSNLLARVAKATAAPPKAPEKPSQFE